MLLIFYIENKRNRLTVTLLFIVLLLFNDLNGQQSVCNIKQLKYNNNY